MLRLIRVIDWKSAAANSIDKVTVRSVLGAKNTNIYCNKTISDERHLKSTDELRHEYNVFYRFPHVRLLGTVNKLKKYSSILTVVGVPSCFLLSSVNLIEPNFLSTFLIVGLATNVLLYSFGTLSYKVIGAMYLSSDGTSVKISYLNFWGKRVNIYCQVDDVVPISEVEPHFVLPYIKFKQFSTSRNLLIPLQFGNIVNKHIFNKVFGSMASL